MAELKGQGHRDTSPREEESVGICCASQQMLIHTCTGTCTAVTLQYVDVCTLRAAC